MEKLETPLTWALVILVLGYFIAGNCCKVQTNNQTNNGFSWSTDSDKANLEMEIITDDSAINVDSIIEAIWESEITYYKNQWGEDSLDINGNLVIREFLSDSLPIFIPETETEE